jgi:hypothetical protein
LPYSAICGVLARPWFVGCLFFVALIGALVLTGRTPVKTLIQLSNYL